MGRWNIRLLGLAVLVSVASVLVPWLTAVDMRSPFAMGVYIAEQLQQEDSVKLVVRGTKLPVDTVYDVVEAYCPYAFSLQARTRANGTVEIVCTLSRPARQRQAEQYAQQLAASCITAQMGVRERLRVLHDLLVEMCRYDTVTAGTAQPDGATAPFAADGALLDHKAVCAGYGRAFGMLCAAAGIPTVYISSLEMNHGWNAVRLDGQTYFIDCTFDDPVPDSGSYVSGRFFLCTPRELMQTHRWNQTFYEQVLDALPAQIMGKK